MTQIALNINDLSELVKNSVKEAIREERFSLYQVLIPSASKKEMEAINTICGSPKDYDKSEFVDISEWLDK
jgi:hypothetical protein